MLVAVSEMWPLKQWNSDLWLAATPTTEHLQEPIRSNLVRAVSLPYFSKVSTKAPEDGDGLLLEEEQGVGVCGHSRLSSDVEVVAVIAVIAVGVVCLNYTAFLPYGATFAPTCCSVCRFFFLFPFSMSNKARDMASGLASMATLFKNKRVSSDTSATANVWAQNL